MARDNRVSLVKSDGSIGATNKATATNWPDTLAYQSYGANNDLWGETWTYSDINNTNFGAVVSASGINAGATPRGIGNITDIRITVFYTANAVVASQSRRGLLGVGS